ncbi:MAG: hypothetical protein QXI12_06680 [Candidatus Methanomethyliaceae archaeon]
MQEDGEEGKPKKLGKRAREAKTVIYAKMLSNVHKGMASLLGPDANIDQEEAFQLADALITCEEEYGWNLLGKWMPAMNLLTVFVAVEGRVIKRLAFPPKMRGEEPRKNIPIPKLVKS